MVWDDCDPANGILEGFHEIAASLKSKYNSSSVVCQAVFSIHGYLGVHERKQDTCVLTSLDLRLVSLHTDVGIVESIDCDSIAST